MSVKQSYACTALFAAGWLCLVLGAVPGDPVPLFIMGFLFLAAGFIYHLVYFRCPHCGGTVMPVRLRKGSGIYCPKCGQYVEYL